jgi:hypothetical protein
VISATLVSSRAAEPFYEPSVLRSLGNNRGGFEHPCIGRRSSAALRRGSAPARRPTPTAVTFLNGRSSDISIWWTQSVWITDRNVTCRRDWLSTIVFIGIGLDHRYYRSPNGAMQGSE